MNGPVATEELTVPLCDAERLFKTKHSQGPNNSPLLVCQQQCPQTPTYIRVIQATADIVSSDPDVKTSDPTSPFRLLRKPDFQQTTAATYQKPLELRTATQRQQQLISCICDLQLHSS